MRDQQLRALGSNIEPLWAAERSATVRMAIARRARRRSAVLAAGSIGVAVACAVVVLLAPRTKHQPVAVAMTPGYAPAGVTAPAPASATPLVDGTDLAPGPEGDGRSFVLRAGKARFVVEHDTSHPFRVQAGPVVVEDVGTVFTVAVSSDGAVAVEVQEGSVRVHRGVAVVDVATGERREFVPDVSANRAASDHGEVHASTTTPELPRWRALAESGRYDDAYQALQSAGAGAVHDDTTELLVAADAARLGGHPAEAVPYLQRVVRGHGRDPRAALAAFTLGRVLLDELGRPGEAVDAFERARAAGGAMAEDALAREVEACSRSGDAARARSLAQEYTRAYPSGRRARAVEKFGGAP